MTISGKAGLRRMLLDARRALTPATRMQLDAALCSRISVWHRQHPVTCLGVYWPIRGEPDLQPVYAQLAALGVQLALPVVSGPDRPLDFFAWSPGDAMVKDAYGIAIPARTSVPLAPDALLIPCVGFNHARMRLGYGGGFYDRTLARMPRPQAIGIAYSFTCADFASEAHDIALDTILTDAAVMTHDVK